MCAYTNARARKYTYTCTHTHTHTRAPHLRLLATITASGFERLHSHHRKINYKISLLRRFKAPHQPTVSSRSSQTVDIILRSIRIRSQTRGAMRNRASPRFVLLNFRQRFRALEESEREREKKADSKRENTEGKGKARDVKRVDFVSAEWRRKSERWAMLRKSKADGTDVDEREKRETHSGAKTIPDADASGPVKV